MLRISLALTGMLLIIGELQAEENSSAGPTYYRSRPHPGVVYGDAVGRGYARHRSGQNYPAQQFARRPGWGYPGGRPGFGWGYGPNPWIRPWPTEGHSQWFERPIPTHLDYFRLRPQTMPYPYPAPYATETLPAPPPAENRNPAVEPNDR